MCISDDSVFMKVVETAPWGGQGHQFQLKSSVVFPPGLTTGVALSPLKPCGLNKAER